VQLVVPEPERFHLADGRAGDEHIAGADKPPEHLLSRRGREIDRDRPLSRRHVEEARAISPGRSLNVGRYLPSRGSGGRFDQDNVSAEVGEEAAGVRGRAAGEVDDGHALEQRAPVTVPALRACASSRWPVERRRTHGTSRCTLRIQCKYGRL
jgi:hypothetical protein